MHGNSQTAARSYPAGRIFDNLQSAIDYQLVTQPRCQKGCRNFDSFRVKEPEDALDKTRLDLCASLNCARDD
jgi:hypothetical protein